MREIDLGIKVSGHAFMVGRFTSIIIGNGAHPVDERGISEAWYFIPMLCYPDMTSIPMLTPASRFFGIVLWPHTC